MKKFRKFIKGLLTYIFMCLLIALLIVTIYTFVYSKMHNISMENTFSYIKSMYSEIFGFEFDNMDSDSLLADDKTNNENVSINNNLEKKKYYYEQLDDYSKIIYTALENNIENLKKDNYTIDFSTKFNDLLHTSTGNYRLNKSFQSALDAFFYDYPELFYINLTKFSMAITSHSIGPITTHIVSIKPKDGCSNYLTDEFKTEAQVDIAISKIETIKNNTINTLLKENDYTKILETHNMLINSLEYSSSDDTANSRNVYGALVQKNVVCEGYSKAFKYLLDYMDIENIIVSGTATNSSGQTDGHMWNYVKLYDNWYAVDVTWDDPIIIGNPSKNTLRHNYFLKGSKSFIKSHSPSGKISDNGMLFTLPSLNKEDYKK